MTTRRPRQPKAPRTRPASAAEGAKVTYAAVTPLFDIGDGNGADWHMMADSLFLVAFQTLDRLPEEERRRMAQRVSAGAYERFLASEGGAGDSFTPTAAPAKPSAALAFEPKARP